jgi:hypothetical protein
MALLLLLGAMASAHAQIFPSIKKRRLDEVQICSKRQAF